MNYDTFYDQWTTEPNSWAIRNGYTEPQIEAVLELAADIIDAEPLTYPAFDANMSKADMVEHIVEVHGVGSHGAEYIHGNVVTSRTGTKATKDQLIEWHRAVHARLDDPEAEFTVYHVRRGYDENRRPTISGATFHCGGVPVPTRPHGHDESVDPALLEGVTAVRNNKRATEGVLTVTERKVLTEVVNNDFGTLKQEMRAFASDSLTAKRQEVNAEWDAAEKSIPDFATQATNLKRKQTDEWAALRAKHAEAERRMREKHEDAMRTVIDKALERGVTLSATEQQVRTMTGTEHQTVYTATVQGRKDALVNAEAENKAMLDRALLTLESQRLTAQRQVLLSGVPKTAMPLLESIPDAKSLMVEASARQAKALNGRTEATSD